ncbi:MAG: hypothetical protein RL173_583 [Fibrobacterota bacterium]|jgi:hypothetical protein
MEANPFVAARKQRPHWVRDSKGPALALWPAGGHGGAGSRPCESLAGGNLQNKSPNASLKNKKCQRR